MDAARVSAVQHNGLTPPGLTALCSRCDTAALDNACAEGQEETLCLVKNTRLVYF